MNPDDLTKVEKINYYVALFFVSLFVIYTCLSVKQSLNNCGESTYALVIIILIVISAYIFYTIVKANRFVDFVLGIIAFFALFSIIPLVGHEWDSAGTTINYYKNMYYTMLVGIIYVAGFKIIKYVVRKIACE